MGLSVRQRVMKVLYPAIMWGSRKAATRAVVHGKAAPQVSFYTLSATLNSGKELPFESLRDKAVLIVNTASDCGYTAQYAELQKLYETHGSQLEIIAFPANDFKEQERGDDVATAQFCAVNFGVRFPLAKKAIVIKGVGQHPVFQWLTDSHQNGWNNKAPSWNFSKYLINAKGELTHYFEPSISPLSNEVVKAISG